MTAPIASPDLGNPNPKADAHALAAAAATAGPAHVKRVALGPSQVITELAKLQGWKLFGDGPDVAIEKTYRFKNFLRTMAFVNALAYIAEQQDHHPELLVRFDSCSVRFNTHDVQGISQSDFVCAALVDALVSTERR